MWWVQSQCRGVQAGVLRYDWLYVGCQGSLGLQLWLLSSAEKAGTDAVTGLTDGRLAGTLGLCLRCQPAGTPTKSGWGVGADFDRSWTKMYSSDQQRALEMTVSTSHIRKMKWTFWISAETRDNSESDSNIYYAYPVNVLLSPCIFYKLLTIVGTGGTPSLSPPPVREEAGVTAS